MANCLENKKILWNGDSICAGAKARGNWATRVAEHSGAECYNYAVGGGTIAEGLRPLLSGKARHSVSRTLEQMWEEHPDADYVILEGGTNDADLLEGPDMPSKLGSVEPEDFSGNYDRTTFCGALESVFYRATKYWNGKKIGFIIAHKMGVKEVSRVRRRKYFDMAVVICEKWGIPYLDLWKGCYLNPCLPWMYDDTKTPEENYANDTGFYADGQHLTSRGYDYTTQIVEKWIQSL